MKNPNCDNDKCLTEHGQVRKVPSTGGSNLILCNHCFKCEMAWRKERNKELERDNRFPMLRWNDLEVYDVSGDDHTGLPSS